MSERVEIELVWNEKEEWWDAILRRSGEEDQVYSCGTAMEAIGWAATDASLHVQPDYEKQLKVTDAQQEGKAK